MKFRNNEDEMSLLALKLKRNRLRGGELSTNVLFLIVSAVIKHTFNLLAAVLTPKAILIKK